MCVRDGGAGLVFLVESVVRETQEGLYNEEGENDSAKDGVGPACMFVQLQSIRLCLQDQIEKMKGK